MKSLWNYPSGVSDSEFDDHQLRRAYRMYVEDARADEYPPLPYELWLLEQEEEEE